MSARAITAALLASVLAGCHPAQEPPKKLDFAKLQSLAEKACLCDRSGGGHDSCWQQYKRQTSGHHAEEGRTACEPISETMDCFDEADGDHCVTIAYPVSEGKNLCTAGEAKAFEALLDQYYREDPDSDTAADRAYADVLSGKRPAKTAPGCS